MAKLDELVLELRASTEKLEAGLKRVEGSITKVKAPTKTLQGELNKLSNSYKYQATVAGMSKSEKAAFDLEQKIKKLSKEHGGLSESQKKQVAQMRKYSEEANSASNSSNKLSGSLKVLAPLMAAAFSAATIKSIIDASASMQQLEARLRAATGSTEAASQAMSRLRLIAAEQKVDLLDLSDGFTRLLPALKGGVLNYQQLESILRLTNDNIKAFGLTSGEAQGIFLGLSQTLSSGTVTTEDLRQVTDRLPGSMAAVAKAMGMTVGELKDYIATGTVGAEEIVPALIEAFRANEGAALSMANTWDSVVADMQNNWREFAAILGDTGLMDMATVGLNTLIDSLKLASTLILKYRILWNELTGDTAEAARLQSRYNEVIAELTDMAGGATGALDKLSGNSGSSKGIKGAGKAAEKAAKDFAKLQDAIDDMADAAQYEAMVLGMDNVTKAVFDVDVAVDRLTDKYGKLTESQRTQIELTKKLVKTTEIQREKMEEAAKEAERHAEAMQRPFENAMENIQNVITDTFEGVFDGSINSASDAAKAIKQIFFRMAAETATLQLFGSQGLGAMVGGGGSGGGGSSGGSFSLDSLTGKNLSGSGVGGYLDDIGDFFGLSGPSGSSGISANFSVGSALASVAGDFATDLLGIEGGHADIGGQIGSVIGTAVGGPIGSFLGNIAGSALGSLFGPEPSSKMQTGLFDEGALQARGGLRGDKFSQANQDMVDALGRTALIIQDAFGVDSPLAVAASDRYGFEFAQTENLGIFDADSDLRKQFDTANEFYRGFVDTMLMEAERFSTEVVAAIEGIDFGETQKQLEQALGDLAFATVYDTLGETTETAGLLEQVFTALNEQFDEAVVMAERLGLSIERVNQVREDEIEKLKATAQQSIVDEILNLSGSGEVAKRTEIARYEAQLKDLQAIGADTANAELLHQLKMKQINEQANAEQIQAAQRLATEFERVSESLESALLALQLGADSALSPLEQLGIARANFEETAALAKLGNIDALSDLPSAVNSFLSESRDFNASNAEFKADFAAATEALQSAMGVAGRQVVAQNQTIDTLSSGSYSGTTSDPAMLAAINALAKEQAAANRIAQDSLLEIQKVA